MVLATSSSMWGQYCTTNLYTTGCTVGDDLDAISLGTYNQAPTGCATNGNYEDFTGDTISVQQVVNYSITVTTTYGFGGENFGAWIDFNDDDDFDDAGEFITFSQATFDINTPSVESFIVGSTTPLGYHRLRVRLMFQNASVTAGQSCSNTNWGEAHDYTINVLPPPPCPPPYALTATTLTDTKVELGFISTSAVTNVEYGVSGFTPGMGTTVSGVTSPYIVSSLTANTQYDFYIQDDCSASSNGLSLWTGPDSALTRQPALTAPMTETLDTATVPALPNAGWLNFSSSTKVWQTSTNRFNGPQVDNTTGTGNFAYVDDGTFPFPNTDDVTMITPLVDVSALTIPVLEFFYWSNPSGAINPFFVDVWDGANWNIAAYADSVGTAGNWQQIIIDLTNYTITGPVMARFIVDEDNGFPFPGNDVAVDDISFIEMPPCPNPASLAVPSVTSTSANVTWAGSTVDQFDIEYGPVGFTPGSGTIITSTGNAASISSLTANTFYDVYLYNNCVASGNSTSDTLGPQTFATNCVAITSFPYSENFDGTTWIPGTGFNNLGDTLDNCFKRSPQNLTFNDYSWSVRNGATQSFGTGPNTDNTSGTGNYLYTSGSKGNTGDAAYLNLPDMDLTSLTVPWITYYYHMFGNNIGTVSLQVSIDTGSTWNTVSTWVGLQQPNQSDPWKEDIVDISAYSGPLVKIRFEGLSGGFSSDMAIDDITILEAPACPKPLSVQNLSNTDSSATLSWINSSDSSNVEWGPVGFGQGTGTTGTFDGDTVTLSGLMSNTCYDVYVRSDCNGASNGTSVWVGPITVCTACLPITTLPYTETFDVNGLNCWKIVNNDGDNETWELDTIVANANSGANSATVNSPFFGLSDDWLISPKLTLTGNERMKYSTKGRFAFSSAELTVLISTTNDSIQNFTDTLIPQTTISGSAYVQTQAILSSYTGDVYIAFAVGAQVGFNSGNIQLDDILFEPLPQCLEPDSVNLVLATSSYAVINWGPGGGTSWNLEYGAPGYTPGTGVSLNTNIVTDTIQGLSPSTSYDVYVQSDCGTNGTSIWIGPLSIKTPCITQTLPYVEDFNIDLGCMLAIDGGATPDTWVWSDVGGTTTFGDLNGTGYAIVDSDEFGNGNDMVEDLNSPPIDAGSLPSTSSLIIEFDHFYRDVFQDDSATVQVFDGTSWVDIVSYNADIGAFGAPDHVILDVTAYANANFQVRFHYDDANTWAWWWAIDDLSVTEQLCGIASNLDTSFVTSTTAGLSWGSGSSNWNVEWGPVGFSQGTGVGTLITNATSNPYSLNGLSSSTCYDYYVQDTCLGIGSGPWVGPFTFCTEDTCLLPSPASIPFEENFDGGGFVSGVGANNAGDAISICWSRADNSGGGNFIGSRTGPTGSGNTGPIGGVGGSGYVFYEASGSGVGDSAWLNLPAIDLSGATAPYLRYQYHMFGGDMGDLVAEVNTGSGWVNLNTISGQQQLADTDPFLTDSIDVTSYIGSNVLFRFIITSGGGFESDAAIENVKVDDAAGVCADPTGLDTANVTCIGAELIWSSSAFTVASALEYGPTGFAIGTGVGTIVAPATSPQVITGLTPGTTYEFYVIDFCSVDSSNIVGPFSFTTASGPLSAAFNYTLGTATLNDRPVSFDGSGSAGATSYAWDFGDGNTDIGSTPNNIYTTNGTYDVQLIITGDCGIDSITQQVIVDGISLTENRLGRSLQVYPNPTTANVNVVFNTENSDDAVISILDLSGKVVISINASDLNGKFERNINLGNLAKGTYLMKIESGDLTTQRRIIKH